MIGTILCIYSIFREELDKFGHCTPSDENCVAGLLTIAYVIAAGEEEQAEIEKTCRAKRKAGYLLEVVASDPRNQPDQDAYSARFIHQDAPHCNECDTGYEGSWDDFEHAPTVLGAIQKALAAGDGSDG